MIGQLASYHFISVNFSFTSSLFQSDVASVNLFPSCCHPWWAMSTVYLSPLFIYWRLLTIVTRLVKTGSHLTETIHSDPWSQIGLEFNGRQWHLLNFYFLTSLIWILHYLSNLISLIHYVSICYKLQKILLLKLLLTISELLYIYVLPNRLGL